MCVCAIKSCNPYVYNNILCTKYKYDFFISCRLMGFLSFVNTTLSVWNSLFVQAVQAVIKIIFLVFNDML